MKTADYLTKTLQLEIIIYYTVRTLQLTWHWGGAGELPLTRMLEEVLLAAFSFISKLQVSILLSIRNLVKAINA